MACDNDKMVIYLVFRIQTVHTIPMLCQKKHPFLMPYQLIRSFRYVVFFLILSVFFSNPPLEAQEKFVPPAAKLITSFPFTVFTGGVILIRACVDDYPDSLNFILDTGSG